MRGGGQIDNIGPKEAGSHSPIKKPAFEQAKEAQDTSERKVNVDWIEEQEEDSDNVRALYQSGLKCFEKEEYPEARAYFEKLAKKGYPRAQNTLGMLYHKIENYGEALKWLGEAANQQDTDALYNLGVMHYNGHGIPKKNPIEALKWFGEALEKGHLGAPQGIIAAQYNIGMMYLEEKQKNYLKKALEWFKKAAAGGYGPAKEAFEIIEEKLNKDQCSLSF